MRLAKPKLRIENRVLAIAAMTLVFAFGAHANADSQSDAEALFAEGMKLMQAGNHEQACPKLAESLKLESALGTRFRLAECYEAIGKTASAWSLFREAAAKASASDKYPQASKAGARADALEPKVPKLILDVPFEVATQRGIVITLDGEPIVDTSWEVPLPVDPGKHVIRVEAPGKTPRVIDIEMKASTSKTIRLTPLADPGAIKPNVPIGIAMIGVGAGAMVVGGVFGAMALDLDGTWQTAVKDHCDRATGRCDPDYIATIRKIESGRDEKATISTIGIIAGAALAAAGAVVWIAPWQKKKGKEVTLLPLGPAGLGATVHGSF